MLFRSTLSIDPKIPLFTPKNAFNSGKRGTQDIIAAPNRKNRILVNATSRLIKIAHSLDLYGLGSILDPLGQQVRIGLANDLSLPSSHHRYRL